MSTRLGLTLAFAASVQLSLARDGRAQTPPAAPPAAPVTAPVAAPAPGAAAPATNPGPPPVPPRYTPPAGYAAPGYPPPPGYPAPPYYVPYPYPYPYPTPAQSYAVQRMLRLDTEIVAIQRQHDGVRYWGPITILAIGSGLGLLATSAYETNRTNCDQSVSGVYGSQSSSCAAISSDIFVATVGWSLDLLGVIVLVHKISVRSGLESQIAERQAERARLAASLRVGLVPSPHGGGVMLGAQF